MRVVTVLLTLVLAGCATHWVRQEEVGTALYLRAPDAAAVVFYSSVDGYAPRPAEKARGGVWRVMVPVDREFRYFYRVNGEVVIPPDSQREFDDFGGETCVYSPMAWGQGGVL